MPEKIDLGDGDHWVEIRDLTAQDRKWWAIHTERSRRGKPPAVIAEPDPDNPAVMRERPNPDAAFTIEENYDLMDALAAQIVSAWSFGGEMPFTPEHRRFIPLDLSEAFDEVITDQAARLRRGGPKPTESGAGSATTSSAEIPDTSPAELPQEPSSTPPGS